MSEKSQKFECCKWHAPLCDWTRCCLDCPSQSGKKPNIAKKNCEHIEKGAMINNDCVTATVYCKKCEVVIDPHREIIREIEETTEQSLVRAAIEISRAAKTAFPQPNQMQEEPELTLLGRTVFTSPIKIKGGEHFKMTTKINRDGTVKHEIEPAQKEGVECEHVGGGEWSVKGGKSYAICQKCGKEYRTSLLNVLECEEPQPEPEKESELLEEDKKILKDWKIRLERRLWKIIEEMGDYPGSACDVVMTLDYVEKLMMARERQLLAIEEIFTRNKLETQAKKSFQEGIEWQKKHGKKKT